MDWRLIWYNHSIVGYTQTQLEAEFLCKYNTGFKWTVPKKSQPQDYNKHKNKNNSLKLISIIMNESEC
jgi:hypothetical protein